MRPLDSARFSRLESQRWTAVKQVPVPSVPQGWPELWRLASPFSFSPPFSSSWRISFYLPPFSYQLSSMTSSSFLMLSSFSFSFRLFSLFSSQSPSRLLNKRSPALPARTIQPPAEAFARRHAELGASRFLTRRHDRGCRGRAGCRPPR